MHITPPPTKDPVLDGDMISQSWADWLTAIGLMVSSLDSSGVTADRPTKGLFVGRFYFDTTLGKPIWLKSVRPTTWVDATGASV